MKSSVFALLLAAGVANASPAAECRFPTDIGFDAQKLIPTHQLNQVPGKAIGLLATGLEDALKMEGRYYSEKDWMLFNVDNSSSRYVVVKDPSLHSGDYQMIPVGTIPLGQPGAQERKYFDVVPATPAKLASWNLKGRNALVALEVNDGLGSPRNAEHMVATKVTQLDGTSAYPLVVDDALAQMSGCAKEYLAQAEPRIAFEMETARRIALGTKPASGPEESYTVAYPTWNAAKEQLELRVVFTRTNGDYAYGGGAFLPRRPRTGPRWGLQYGVRTGVIYTVDKTGNVMYATRGKLERFQHFLPPPPIAGGPVRPGLPGRPRPAHP